MRSPLLFASALALQVFSALPAGAQQPAKPVPEDAKAKARALADRGYELYQAGRYEEALAAFRDAERQFRAPTLLLMLARTCEHLGRLVEARSTYESILAEQFPRSAPAAFHEAKDIAKVELAALARRIPFLKVTVTGAAAAAVSLSINGTSAPLTEELIPRDPGRTKVVVSVPGRPPIQRVVTLEEGRTEHLTIQISAAPSAPEPAVQARSEAPPPDPPRGSLLPAALSFGAAGVGLGVGAITGLMAMSKIDDIKSRCTPDGHCLVDDEPTADQARTLITVSTIGFVAAGVAAAAGVTLLILRPGSAAPASPQDARLRVLVGPGSARLEGRF